MVETPDEILRKSTNEISLEIKPSECSFDQYRSRELDMADIDEIRLLAVLGFNRVF